MESAGVQRLKDWLWGAPVTLEATLEGYLGREVFDIEEAAMAEHVWHAGGPARRSGWLQGVSKREDGRRLGLRWVGREEEI